MDYAVKVKKPANQNTRENSHATVNLAQLKYISGMEDIRQASKETIRQKIRDQLRDGIDLDPEYTLNKFEQVVVMPNPRIGKDKRRFGSAIYNDELEIPQEVLAEHRQKRRKTGGGSRST